MHIETSVQKVVQLLIKCDYYEELCPNDEDTWYNYEEVMDNTLLQRLLAPGTIEAMSLGLVDFIVCRGNWQ